MSESTRISYALAHRWIERSTLFRPAYAHLRVASILALAACSAGTGEKTASQGATTQAAQPAQSAPAFDKTEVMIPMRDGVHLHTFIFAPKNVTGYLPIILNRTPYGASGDEKALASPSLRDLEADGYIFVFQDIRGRFGSEGQFVMLRPMRDKSDPNAIDESTDTYDTIDWLLKNVPHNNGRVGMTGTSYPGWLTVMAMLDPHPALKAAIPKASPADMFIGDDFHHNGAFRLSYAFEYATMMEGSKEFTQFKFDEPDLYDWYLKLGSLAHVNERYLHGKYPTWNNFATHASYDSFWKRQAVTPYLDSVRVPTINVAGFWDQEDFYGPVKIYETLEPRDTKHLNYIVIGPWNHGGWGRPTGEKLGRVDFGSATSVYYRKNIEAPFFAYYLKGKGTLNLPEATTFQSGTDKWESYDSWPPANSVTAKKLYFQPDHGLSFTAPTGQGSAFDAYVSDPASPVPYRKRPILPSFRPPSTWSTWLFDDQSFLKGRPDVLTLQTPVLTDDVTIAGNITAHLFASTTGSDADWVVKLIDVYPETEADTALRGYELMVANDVFRGRFRTSFEHPQPITPNKVEEYTIDLHTQDYRFLKGHRIMVQVQSSWFPLIDRNPQTFVPNIFEAKDSDFKKATQRIYHSPKSASYIQLHVK